MTQRHLAMTAAWLAVATATASASGGIGCEGKGTGTELSIESGVTRGMGSPVFNFRGVLAVTDTAAAADLRKTELSGEHLAQYWLDDKALNMVVYRERGADAPHGYVEALVKTAPSDEEGTYAGSYSLTVFDTQGDTTGEGRTLKYTGQVTCFVE